MKELEDSYPHLPVGGGNVHKCCQLCLKSQEDNDWPVRVRS